MDAHTTAALQTNAAALAALGPGAEIQFEWAGRTVRGTREGFVKRTRRGHGVTAVYVRVRTLAGTQDFRADLMRDIRAAAAPALPECSAFVGDGQRCGECRTRKALHA